MKTLLKLIILLLTLSCSSQKVSRPIANYDWEQPEKIYELPSGLKEVSGLTRINDRLIGCVEDEHGIFYIYDIVSNEIVQKIPFGEPGDYEGVARVEKSIYILRSDGELFEIRNFESKQPEIDHFPSGAPAMDNEGLFYNSATGLLLIACKGKFGKGLTNQFRREIHQFDPKKKELKGQMLYSIKIDSVIAFAENKGIDLPKKTKNNVEQSNFKLRMSGLAIHPQTKDVYILSAFDNAVLIFHEDGELKHIVLLNERIFPRPEGIDFLSNGDLLIANENKEDGGTIVHLKYTISNTKILDSE